MPYKTKYGTHYHEVLGCHGADIPCGTEGLEPCSDCCGGGTGGSAGTHTASSVAPSLSATMAASPADDPSEHEAPAATGGDGDGQVSASRAAMITDMGADMMSDGQPMPDDEEGWERLFAEAFGTQLAGGTGASTSRDRIYGLFDVINEPAYDDSIIILADIAAGNAPERNRETEQAIADGPAIAMELMRVIRLETDEARRKELLLTLGDLSSSALLRGTLASLSSFPARWHQTRSLSYACNQHDMFYIAHALTDKSPRKRMTLDDYEKCVLPMLETLADFALSGFRRFPRTITAPKRFPDGPDGDRAWGTQTTILVMPGDVDDPKALALMDRDDFKPKSGMEPYRRGVPGYWQVDIDPQGERDGYVKAVQLLVRHSKQWGRMRGMQAVREFDRNMMPILRWLASDGTMERLTAADDVEAADLT